MNKLRSKKFLGLPVLAWLMVMLVPAVAAAAYVVATVHGEVTVSESLTVSPETFSMDLWPGESGSQDIEVSNAADFDMVAHITYTSTSELDVTLPDRLDVPADSSATVTCEVDAPMDIEPDTFDLDIEVARGNGHGHP